MNNGSLSPRSASLRGGRSSPGLAPNNRPPRVSLSRSPGNQSRDNVVNMSMSPANRSSSSLVSPKPSKGTPNLGFVGRKGSGLLPDISIRPGSPSFGGSKNNCGSPSVTSLDGGMSSNSDNDSGASHGSPQMHYGSPQNGSPQMLRKSSFGSTRQPFLPSPGRSSPVQGMSTLDRERSSSPTDFILSSPKSDKVGGSAFSKSPARAHAQKHVPQKAPPCSPGHKAITGRARRFSNNGKSVDMSRLSRSDSPGTIQKEGVKILTVGEKLSGLNSGSQKVLEQVAENSRAANVQQRTASLSVKGSKKGVSVGDRKSTGGMLAIPGAKGGKRSETDDEEKKQELRRGSIRIDPEDLNQSDSQKASIDTIARWLYQVPLLANLAEAERRTLANHMEEISFNVGQAIIKQGELGDGFYIVRDGRVRVSRVDPQTGENIVVCTMRPGDFFGEAALLKNQARGATVHAHSQLKVLFLDKKKFKQLFLSNKQSGKKFQHRTGISAEVARCSGLRPSSAMPHKASKEKSTLLKDNIRKALCENTLFSDISDKHIDCIIRAMWVKDVPAGTAIFQQGDLGDNLYVVESGEMDVSVDEEKIFVKKPYQLIGELALMYGHARSATIVANQDSRIWVIDRFTFRRILTNTSKEELQNREDTLKQVPVLNPLSMSELSKVAEALERASYGNGAVIVKQGDVGDAMYIITNGKVVVKKDILGKDVKVGALYKSDFFGERALLKNETRAASIVAKGPVECLRLDRHAFSLLLGSLSDLLHEKDEEYSEVNQKAEEQERLSKTMELKKNNSENASLALPPKAKAASGELDSQRVEPKPKTPRRTHPIEQGQIPQEELEVTGLLGKGSFGTVNLVRHKNPITGISKMYALKAVAKGHVVKTKQEEHVMNEKAALVILKHPMIIQLYCTYQNPTYLYFLMEPAMGGELFSLLRTRSMLPDEEARFYAASILLVFEYMHDNNVVYRDLKPENMLLDHRGYLKLTDYGFAKILEEEDGRTWTLCGTPDYLAPEVILGTGHGKGVDWWCLGILLYEMLAGQAPFYDDNPMRSYAKIKKGHIDYPFHMSPSAVDICQNLLKVKNVERWGIVKGGTQRIKDHSWFKDLDWDKLINFEISAPWVPDIKNETDITNFDDYSDDPDVEHKPYTGNTSWCKNF